MSCKSNVLFVKSIVLATFLTILYSKKDGSSFKCVDAFRSALTQEPKLLIKQKYSWAVNYLSYFHPLSLKIFSF